MNNKIIKKDLFSEREVYRSVKKEYENAATSFSMTRNYFWPDLAFIKDYIKKNSKILDFGCGNGRLLELTKIDPKNYLGIDVSNNLIKIAQKKYPRHHFKTIDPFLDDITLSIKSEKQKFDLIIAIGVFHHFPPGKKRELIFKRLADLLNSQGIIIISAWNLNSGKYLKYIKNNAGFIPFKNSEGKLLFRRYIYVWKKKELEDFFKEAGFSILRSGKTIRNNKSANIYCVGRKI